MINRISISLVRLAISNTINGYTNARWQKLLYFAMRYASRNPTPTFVQTTTVFWWTICWHTAELRCLWTLLYDYVLNKFEGYHDCVNIGDYLFHFHSWFEKDSSMLCVSCISRLEFTHAKFIWTCMTLLPWSEIFWTSQQLILLNRCNNVARSHRLPEPVTRFIIWATI